ELRGRLSKSRAEREVAFIADFLKYVQAYFDNKMSADDYAYYTKNVGEFQQLWDRYSQANLLPSLDLNNALFAKFYKVNLDRNTTFLAKIGVTDAEAGKPALKADSVDENIFLMNSQLSMPEANNNVDVVVTGGFHTQGLANMLEAKGISYVVITPNVTGDTVYAQKMYDTIAREFAAVGAVAKAGGTQRADAGSVIGVPGDPSKASLAMLIWTNQIKEWDETKIKTKIAELHLVQLAIEAAAIPGNTAEKIVASMNASDSKIKAALPTGASIALDDAKDIIITYPGQGTMRIPTVEGRHAAVVISEAKETNPAAHPVADQDSEGSADGTRLLLPDTLARLKFNYTNDVDTLNQIIRFEELLKKPFKDIHDPVDQAIFKKWMREAVLVETNPLKAGIKNKRSRAEFTNRHSPGAAEFTTLMAVLKSFKVKVTIFKYTAVALSVLAGLFITSVVFASSHSPLAIAALLIVVGGYTFGVSIFISIESRFLLNYLHLNYNLKADPGNRLILKKAVPVSRFFNGTRIVGIPLSIRNVTFTIDRHMGLLTQQEVSALAQSAIEHAGGKFRYPGSIALSYGDTSSIVRNNDTALITVDRSVQDIADYAVRNVLLKSIVVHAMTEILHNETDTHLTDEDVEYAADQSLHYQASPHMLSTALKEGTAYFEFAAQVAHRIQTLDVPMDTLDVSKISAELQGIFSEDGNIVFKEAAEFLRKYTWAVDKQVNAGNRVEGNWPVTKAFALLDDAHQQVLVDFIVKNYVTRKTSKVPALLNAILLMSADRNTRAHAYQDNWLKRQAPHLIGRVIYFVSAETHFWSGGLGPVMQFLGHAMKLLGARVVFIEPKYAKRFDNELQQERDLDYSSVGVVIDNEPLDTFKVETYRGDDPSNAEKVTVTAKVFRGIGSDMEVFLIDDFDKDGNTFFTKTLYRYRENGMNLDNPSKAEFMTFFDKATAVFIGRQETKRLKEKDALPAIVHANDGQIAPLLAIIKSMVAVGTDNFNALAKIIPVFTTHTFVNRINDLVESVYVTWMGIARKFLPYAATSKDGLDASRMGIAVASSDPAGSVHGVSWNHVLRLAQWNPFRSTDREPLDSFSRIDAMTNAAAPATMAATFRKLLTLRPGQHPDEPDAEQIKVAKVRSKQELNKKQYPSSTGTKVNISPNRMLITFCRRMVPEKAGRTRALTDENILAMLKAGVDIVLFGADQRYEASSKLADELQELQRKIEAGEIELGANHGNFFYVRNYTGEAKVDLLAASNLQIQDSDEGTGANEFTEEDIAANAGINYGTPEGTIINHGITLEFDSAGNVVKPGNVVMNKDSDPKLHRDLLLKIIALYENDPDTYFRLSAISPRVNRANAATITGAANLEAYNDGIENARVWAEEDAAAIEAITATVPVELLKRIVEGHETLNGPFQFVTPSVRISANGNGLKAFINKKTDLEHNPIYPYGQFMLHLTDKADYEKYIIGLFGGRENSPAELIEWFARLNHSPAAEDKKNERFNSFIEALVHTIDATPREDVVTTPRLIEGAEQDYSWGTAGFIADLLRKPVRLIAELWLGAHPKAPSTALVDGMSVPLNELIARDPAGILGTQVAARFNNRLPYLFKVLSAARPLSIQVHPGKPRAEKGFDRENREGKALDAVDRNYKDDNHKPEIISAITEFWGLNGFKPVPDIVRSLKALETPIPGLSELEKSLSPGKDDTDQQKALRKFYSEFMALTEQEYKPVIHEIVKRAQANKSQSKEEEAYWVVQSNQWYPDDRGIISIYLLNLVNLHPGEAMYAPAGALHAYLEGTGMELMANSDNVLRGGLTPKHIDVKELLRTLTFDRGATPIIDPRDVSETEKVYDTPAAEFVLSTIDVTRKKKHNNTGDHSADILIAIDGEVQIISENGTVIHLIRGQSVMVPAGAGQYTIESLSKTAKIYKASVPSPENMENSEKVIHVTAGGGASLPGSQTGHIMAGLSDEDLRDEQQRIENDSQRVARAFPSAVAAVREVHLDLLETRRVPDKLGVNRRELVRKLIDVSRGNAVRWMISSVYDTEKYQLGQHMTFAVDVVERILRITDPADPGKAERLLKMYVLHEVLESMVLVINGKTLYGKEKHDYIIQVIEEVLGTSVPSHNVETELGQVLRPFINERAHIFQLVFNGALKWARSFGFPTGNSPAGKSNFMTIRDMVVNFIAKPIAYYPALNRGIHAVIAPEIKQSYIDEAVARANATGANVVLFGSVDDDTGYTTDYYREVNYNTLMTRVVTTTNGSVTVVAWKRGNDADSILTTIALHAADEFRGDLEFAETANPAFKDERLRDDYTGIIFSVLEMKYMSANRGAVEALMIDTPFQPIIMKGAHALEQPNPIKYDGEIEAVTEVQGYIDLLPYLNELLINKNASFRPPMAMVGAISKTVHPSGQIENFEDVAHIVNEEVIKNAQENNIDTILLNVAQHAWHDPEVLVQLYRAQQALYLGGLRLGFYETVTDKSLENIERFDVMASLNHMGASVVYLYNPADPQDQKEIAQQNERIAMIQQQLKAANPDTQLRVQGSSPEKSLIVATSPEQIQQNGCVLAKKDNLNALIMPLRNKERQLSVSMIILDTELYRTIQEERVDVFMARSIPKTWEMLFEIFMDARSRDSGYALAKGLKDGWLNEFDRRYLLATRNVEETLIWA
ncbi:MAG: mannose-6-phosphate isomerase, class I, partial [Endomicrobiales bacterium]